VELDAPLPDELGAGAATAVFVAGWCVAGEHEITALELLVDGAPQPVTAHGMPRLDVFKALHPALDAFATRGVTHDPDSPEDPALHGYRSGFWGLATIGPRDAGEVALGLRAHLADGRTAHTELARLPIVAAPRPIPILPPADGPLVAVCMATFDPPPELFARQVASLRAQTHANWVCLISDDGSSPERFAALQEQVAGDPRFAVSRTDRRLGFYRNFERALQLAPPAAAYVALADQDDEWHPDKLETLIAALDHGGQLAYSDARIVARDGTVLADTYWETRRNNHRDLLSLLVANAVTGAAALFPRALLDDALPFPPAQFHHYHDHWLGLVALARGDIAYVDRPLYDYVQHGSASLGHAAANRMPTLRDRAGALRRDPRERVRLWRLHYFADVCRLTQVATILELRLGDRMTRRKRRALRRLIDADRRAPALARLAVRGAREVIGRRRPETLGAEWMLAYAFAWRRLLAATTRDRPTRGLRLDAVPPASLIQQPGERLPGLPEVRVMAEKVTPLSWRVVPDAPARIDILIPTIDLDHFFGGYIGKLNLAARLADRGARVRIVTVDPVPPLPRDWRERLEAYSGLSGIFHRVEVAFGRDGPALERSPRDRLVASTWWTAHIAAHALRDLDAERFLYLIQEYEPFTFPNGTWAALAEQSYRFPHTALFSTELLREWFRLHGIGVYAAGTETGDRDSVAFRNAITPVQPPTAAELAARGSRRLLFYARPEPHAARNLFELGALALRRAHADGALDGWELRGIGTVDLGRRLSLGGGAMLDLLPRAAQGAYGALLREHDVGLALMHTPHPSLVPIEMASAGLVTVTSAFENKTPEKLAAISPNLLTAEPTVEGVAGALAEAVAAAGDAERRVAGSAVDWSRDWRDSFDDALLDRVSELLG
jgi:glycosyltransferase involved in cell wall biosynthesis